MHENGIFCLQSFWLNREAGIAVLTCIKAAGKVKSVFKARFSLQNTDTYLYPQVGESNCAEIV